MCETSILFFFLDLHSLIPAKPYNKGVLAKAHSGKEVCDNKFMKVFK